MKMLFVIGAIATIFFAILTLSVVRPRKGQRHFLYHLEGSPGLENAWAVLTRDGTDRETVHLPWTFGFWERPGTPIVLSAQFQDDSTNGILEARLSVDGQPISSARSSGNEGATIRCTLP